jgi:hypothetical protein
MSALEIVLLVLVVVAVAGALLSIVGVLGAPRRKPPGANWIDHPDETPVDQRPSEDAPDPSVPALSRSRIIDGDEDENPRGGQ